MKKILSVILALSLLSVLFAPARGSSKPKRLQGAKDKLDSDIFLLHRNHRAGRQKIAELSSSDIYKIEPAEPYTSDDLNYNNSDCRANVEQNDPDARPEIAGYLPDLSEYDRVYLGFPIWWGNQSQNHKHLYRFLQPCGQGGFSLLHLGRQRC